MIGYRRAAVELHALGEEDRRLILAALPNSDQAMLGACLDELRELGFSSDAISLSELASLSTDTEQPASPQDRIQYATARQIFAVLENEPASLIGQFLSIKSWRWSKDFLLLFSAGRQEKIREALNDTSKLAPVRQDFLLDAVAQRLIEKEKKGRSVSFADIQKQPLALHSSSVTSRLLSPVIRLVTSWRR
jgi:hypothetical protein